MINGELAGYFLSTHGFRVHVSRLEFIGNGYRAAVCDVICLEAVVVLPGGKTMECLYGNGRKFASFLLTIPALVIEHLQY